MKKIEDVVNSIKDVALSEYENAVIPEISAELAKSVISESAGIVVEELFKSVMPVVGNVVATYKLRRLERNMNESIRIISERQDEIDSRLNELQHYEPNYLQSLLEGFIDTIIDEIQLDKVKYSTIGCINLIKSRGTNTDFALQFFNTLSQLNVLDIRILKLYGNYFNQEDETIDDIISDLGIEYKQVNFVKEKLARLGLIKNSKEEIRNKNLNEICDFFHKYEREKQKKKPNDIKAPKLTKIMNHNSFKITPMGREFLNMIEQQEND